MITIFSMNYFCLVFIFTLPLTNDLYHNILTFWTHSTGGSSIVVCVGTCWTVRGLGTSCGAVFGCRANNLCLHTRSGGTVVSYKEIHQQITFHVKHKQWNIKVRNIQFIIKECLLLITNIISTNARCFYVNLKQCHLLMTDGISRWNV